MAVTGRAALDLKQMSQPPNISQPQQQTHHRSGAGDGLGSLDDMRGLLDDGPGPSPSASNSSHYESSSDTSSHADDDAASQQVASAAGPGGDSSELALMSASTWTPDYTFKVSGRHL